MARGDKAFCGTAPRVHLTMPRTFLVTKKWRPLPSIGEESSAIWSLIWSWVCHDNSPLSTYCCFFTLYSLLTQGAIAVLESLPGCQAQLPHIDYTLAELRNMGTRGMKEKECPLSAVYALQECSLNIWPEALVLKSYDKRDAQVAERLVLSLQPGQLLLFRGDLVHGGSSYESLNHRLHFFLDSKFLPRGANSTQQVKGDGKLWKIKID